MQGCSIEAWQSKCGIQKIVQTDPYGCGIACLAMLSGTDYGAARSRFVEIGLGVRRSCRPAFSTTSTEMRAAIASTGLLLEQRRWRGWESFYGLGVLKVRDDWRGAKGKWHWVIAFKHPEFDITIFDPHDHLPAFREPPLDTFYTPFERYEPKGEWLQVEQRMCLSSASQCSA